MNTGERSDSVLILASQSPRRSEILRAAGIGFEVISPRYEEPEPEEWPHCAVELAEATSYFKAASVGQAHPGRVILGADTTVALGDRLFGKAADEAHARRILRTLMGTTHQVVTGITVLQPASMARVIQHDVTHVTMRQISDAELDAYIATGEWRGKAGAYGIQDACDPFVERIEGSFTNVVGLPIDLVLAMLRRFGIEPTGPGDRGREQ